MLEFCDSGCGMEKATMERIFEPFYTTKGEGKGTGLGLSTVYGIVKQSKGFIDVTSTVGHGTTFRLFFPRHLETPELLQETSAPQTCEGTETILLVEDEEPILRFCKRFLVANGYQVLAARNPGEAILLVENHRGELHLLITDVIMPWRCRSASQDRETTTATRPLR